MTDSPARFAALAAMLVCLPGCGLKGDLYIPEPEPTNEAQSAPLAVPEAGEEQNDDETTGN